MIAGIGVGLSGILARPLFSVAVTYLVVAALVVGTLIAFGLGGSAIRSETVNSYRTMVYDEQQSFPQVPPECIDCDEPGQTEPLAVRDRTDRADLHVRAVADHHVRGRRDSTGCGGSSRRTRSWCSPTRPRRRSGTATRSTCSARSSRACGSRSSRPSSRRLWDECDPAMPASASRRPPRRSSTSTTPSWFVGLAIQLALTAALLWWAWARTRTPARRLPPGTRIA